MLNHKVSTFLVLYLGYAIFCSCAGWILSGLRCLDGTGYLLLSMIGIGCFLFYRDRFAGRVGLGLRQIAARTRRFTRSLFPILFLVVAVLVFLSGAVNPQNYGDANSYHVPRVLQWLQAHTWHWIPTYDNRQNTRGCAFEWMEAPLLILTGSDRFTFLINWVAFLLFPGLLYQTLTLMRVSPRAAWHWMWLFPTGFGYICQSGASCADFLGGFFALSAINLALVSHRHFHRGLVALSLVTFALATGSRPFTVFLAIPYALALFPLIRRFFPIRPIYLCLIILAGVFCSFFFNAGINYLAVHDWSGLVLEPWVLRAHTPWIVRLIVSGAVLFYQNILPPYIPYSQWINHRAELFLTGNLGAYLRDHFEEGTFSVCLNYTITDTAALGPLLVALLACGLFLTRRHYLEMLRDPVRENYYFWLRFSGTISLVVLVAMSTLSQIGRIALPFYAFVLPFLLSSPAQAALTRQRWWRWLAGAQFAMAILFLLFLPARPVFPVQTTLNLTEKVIGKNHFLEVLEENYAQGYARVDGLEWIRSALPNHNPRLGLIRIWFDSESILWKPFGGRHVVTIISTDTPESLRRKGVTYAAISRLGTLCYFGVTPEDWAKNFGGERVTGCTIDSNSWSLVALDSGPSTQWSAATPPFLQPSY